jgi:hypothetical protein
MPQFQLLAQPLWVNLLLLIPLALFFGWRSIVTFDGIPPFRSS